MPPSSGPNTIPVATISTVTGTMKSPAITYAPSTTSGATGESSSPCAMRTSDSSAIQSRNYKLIESLCRRPDVERLDSPAYRSVAPVRERVLGGLPNLSEALAGASIDRAGIHRAMDRFQAVLLEWRQTHFRLAVRMLGERRGTGYTEGVPYLDQGREAPVFAVAA